VQSLSASENTPPLCVIIHVTVSLAGRGRSCHARALFEKEQTGYAVDEVIIPKQHNLHFRWKPAGALEKQEVTLVCPFRGNFYNTGERLLRNDMNVVMQLITFRAQFIRKSCLTGGFKTFDCMSSGLNMRTSFQILRMNIACDFDLQATT